MNAWFVVRRRRVATGNCLMDGLANAFGIGDVRNSYWFDIAMEPLVYLEPDRDAWLRAGELSAECSARGFAVGIADCLLAALAMRENASMFTLDRDFERIPRLRLFRRSQP